MTRRLSLAELPGLASGIARPSFDPRTLGVGIVHLGCGAFHRAHQAPHTQAAIEAAGGSWGIAAVSLRGEDVPRRLAPQDGLFTVAIRGAEETHAVIGVLREILGPGDRATAVAAIARPSTRIVSLTVTEKGYVRDAASGALDLRDPGIAADLVPGAVPRTAPGLVVAGLARRRAAGLGGVAVMSCDNLPDNGHATARVVDAFARQVDPGLARWIADNVAFPSTMVDRIVPATTPADIEAVSRALGCRDEACVVTEPFSQWVIEDRFPGGRPAWEAGGAQLVADVAPFEEMKLRLLNGSHSMIAYLGYLAGHETVADAIAAPGFAALVGRLWDEAQPTLRVPAGTDLGAYRHQLLARYRNPRLRHRTWQIAMDGTQKLPQRLLAPIRQNLAAGRPIATAALAVAAWMRYVRGVDERGAAIDVRDPLASTLETLRGGAPRARAAALLGLDAVFGEDLRAVPRFVDAVATWLERLERDGAAATVRAAAAV